MVTVPDAAGALLLAPTAADDCGAVDDDPPLELEPQAARPGTAASPATPAAPRSTDRRETGTPTLAGDGDRE
jgi:hypothetical protein